MSRRVAAAPGATVLAVDVGGTKVRTALADDAGVILAERTEPTRSRDGDAFAAQLRRMLAEMRSDAGRRAEAGVRRAAIAVPVTIDPRTGDVASEHNVPGLAIPDLRAWLERVLGIPVSVENDANLAALAEGRHGAAIGLRDFVVVAIGTGIGMGVVVDGRLVRGARGRAGELGFVPVGADPTHPASRRAGALERAAAGPALRRRIDAAARGRTTTALRPGDGLEAVVAAASGDAVARRLLEGEARLLARGIAAVVAILDPGLVLLAGGVGAVPGLAAPVGDALAAIVADPPRVATAALGDRGPLIGAIDAALGEAPAGP